MTEILEKADKAYSLIKKCEGNDGAMVEDKAAIDRLINEVSDLYEKCETEPKARDNLAYQFEYDTCCTLETKVGKILELDANEHGKYRRFLGTDLPSSPLGLILTLSQPQPKP